MSRLEGKTQAVKEWASTWPEIDGYIKLNAILGDRDEASMSTIHSDAKGKPYIDGTARHVYTFGLKMMLPWSDGYDDTNEEANRLMESWRDWVDEQFPGNVPEWPGASIESIEAAYDEPAVTVYQQDSLAEYTFIAKITYEE